jgi:ketosteroid isomerase-like protein
MSELGKIRETLDRFALGWRKADAAILKSTWDRSHPESIYQASEQGAPVYGFPAISQYYDDATSMYPITSMEISNVRVQQFGDVAHAFCDIAIGFQVGASEYLVHPRATFLLKKQANGEWLTLHYHESIKYEVPKS